jgi:hypothetical protein
MALLVAEEAVECVDIAGTCGRGAWGSRTRVCGGDHAQGHREVGVCAAVESAAREKS